MKSLSSAVVYPDTEDQMVWNGGAPRLTELDGEGCVVVDWGSVMAAPNPENPTKRVVLLHGTNTYGTMGAMLSLIDSPPAMRNHLLLESLGLADRLTGKFNVEIAIRAEVGVNRRVKTPVFEAGLIRKIHV